jgi:hypothetical protein
MDKIQHKRGKVILLSLAKISNLFYLAPSDMAACAAARRAIGTLNGEHDT